MSPRVSLPILAASFAGLAWFVFSAPAQNSGQSKGTKAVSPPTYGNADAVNEDELKAYLYFLASNQLEGRNYPSRGFDTAALYVASHLAEWGLKPGGSASGTNGPLQPYFMPMELESRELLVQDSKATLTSAPLPGGPPGAPQTASFDYAKDWTFGTPGSPVQATAFDVSGNLVFAGDGYVSRKTGADPYKGIDVRGKIIVVAGRPQEIIASGEPCVDFFTVQQAAARNGALAVLFVADSNNAASIAQPRPASANGPPYVVKKFDEEPASSCPSAPIVSAGLEFANALFTGERHNGAEILYVADRNASVYPADYKGERRSVPEPESFALSERKTLHLRIAMRNQPGHGENVIGILEGSDPVLKNEYVILSAHLDHLGLSAPQPDGHNVFSGADDNGSGSAGLLAVAHAFAEGAAKGIRPKRSILFLWTGGEEKGYSGSRYFAEFPPIDLSKVVALVNMDMIGRTKSPAYPDANKMDLLMDRSEILLIGPNIGSDDLEKTIESVNGNYQKLKLNHFYDVTKPDATHDNLGSQFGQGFFFRSDQYNFARIGIPVAYFTTGQHADYHRPPTRPRRSILLNCGRWPGPSPRSVGNSAPRTDAPS